MAKKYILQIKENGQWVDNGDGPLTCSDALRMEREVRRECRVQTRVVPEDFIDVDRDQVGAQAMEMDNGI